MWAGSWFFEGRRGGPRISVIDILHAMVLSLNMHLLINAWTNYNDWHLSDLVARTDKT